MGILDMHGTPVNPEQDKDDDILKLKAGAYPITRIYCNQFGLVCGEREGCEPLMFNTVSPRRSRETAAERVFALLNMVPEGAPERMFPISVTGRGLSYDAAKMQLLAACQESMKIEARRKEEFKQKKARYASDFKS